MNNQIKKIVKNKEFICMPSNRYNFVIMVKSDTKENEHISIGLANTMDEVDTKINLYLKRYELKQEEIKKLKDSGWS